MKYKPRLIWSGSIASGLLLIVLLALHGFLSNPLLWTDKFALLPFVLLIFMGLHVLFGMYVFFDESKLCRVDFFFWKQCLLIKDINSIVYHSSFVVGGANKTVSIFDGAGKKIFMESMPFGKEMQRDLISNLVRLSPSIRLNEGAEAFLRENK